MLSCSLPIIAYQLANGIFRCTEEAAHSKAVLARLRDSKRTMYVMKIQPLEDQVHCACNFKDSTLAGPENVKLAGSVAELRKQLPSLVAEYKLRRVLFDDPQLYETMAEPGLRGIMELIPYTQSPAGSEFAHIPRFEPSLNTRPVSHPRPPSLHTDTTESSSLGRYVIAAIVIIVIILGLRSC